MLRELRALNSGRGRRGDDLGRTQWKRGRDRKGRQRIKNSWLTELSVEEDNETGAEQKKSTGPSALPSRAQGKPTEIDDERSPPMIKASPRMGPLSSNTRDHSFSASKKAT